VAFDKEILPLSIRDDVTMQVHWEQKQVQVTIPEIVCPTQSSKTFRFVSDPVEGAELALNWILQYLHQWRGPWARGELPGPGMAQGRPGTNIYIYIYNYI